MLGPIQKWVYAFLSPIGGYIADRFSRRLVIIASLFIWSAITWSTGYDDLRRAGRNRALMGISEAFYIPAALALITDFHRGTTRSRAVGIHQMGIYAGIILGGFAGHVADQPSLGWRFAFQTCGIVGILYSFPLYWMLREPTPSPTAKSHPTRCFGPGSSCSRIATTPPGPLFHLYRPPGGLGRQGLDAGHPPGAIQPRAREPPASMP